MSTPTVRERPASIGGAIRSEWIKFRGVRSTWWIIALAIVVPLLAITVWAANRGPLSTSTFDETNAVLGATTSSLFESLVLFVLLGSLIGTSEYETRTISTTMAAVPRRWPVLVAKTVVVAVTVLVVSLIVLTLGFLLSAALIPTSAPVPLTAPGVMGALIGAAIFQLSAALISLYLGLALRSSIGAIAATFGFFYLVPGVINLVSLPAFQAFGHSFPGPASDSLIALVPPAEGLPYAAAAISIVVWTAVWFGVCHIVTRRKDV